jgi:MFS family permease
VKKTILTRTVLLLGLVSFFTDIASEMLYPVMPLYLESIGFTIIGIGTLEGIAQALAGLSKGYFGRWSDQVRRRAPFVRWGYLLSAVAKPLMAVWTYPLWVLAARTADRLGKGIRTGARDAMLSAEAVRGARARVFGFHRGMDTLGAATGPGIALIFLWQWPADYRSLFFWAFLPGVAAVSITLLLREAPPLISRDATRPALLDFLKYIPQSSPPYRRLLTGLLAFALINSSDFFLLLLLKERGFSDTLLIGFYIFYNLVYALAAYPLGSLADRWGLKRIFTAGLLLFAGVYGGMAAAGTWWVFAGLFLAYGLYAAATEGVAKAWISNLCRPEETGTAIGAYEGLRSVATLLASTLAGGIWHFFGPKVLFSVTAIAALSITLYVGRLRDGDVKK